MMLAHPFFSEPIILGEDTAQVVVIESQSLFSRLLSELMAQEEGKGGDFVLSDNFSPIELSEHMLTILNFFRFDFDNRRVQTKLNAYLKNLAFAELRAETVKLLSKLGEYFQALSEAAAVPLSYDVPQDAAALVKLGNFKPEIEGNSLPERLLSYMEFINELFGISCFALVNAKSFLSSDELLLFYKSAVYKKYRLVLLENILRDKASEYERVYIIDRDLCEIRE